MCVYITLYAKSVGKGSTFACNSWLCAVQTAHPPLLSCARWAHTCSVAHLISNSHTCSSQNSPPTAWIKPPKTGMGRQQCADWLGSRSHSSWKAVLHQAPLCLSGTHTLWCMLSQHVAHGESIPVSTPNPLGDSVVRRVTGLTFCLCSGVNPMLRKWEQILLLVSLWDCIFPQVEIVCHTYGLGEPGEIRGCLDINHFRGIRLY